MSKKRQPPIFNPQGAPAAQLTTLTYTFTNGYVVPDHFHEVDQLVFASKGTMTIGTCHGIWVVPPLRAVWIPSNEAHSITMSGAVAMQTLYFAPKYVRSFSRKCVVVNVSPLLRELILHLCNRKSWTTSTVSNRRIIDVTIEQLKEASTMPLQLPHPNDARARRVADILFKNPSDPRTLYELCAGVGGSMRTVERIFTEETHMTFGKWRRHLRLLHGMRLMAAGEKVITAALEAGYDSPSAFISVFKKTFGQTPSKYFE